MAGAAQIGALRVALSLNSAQFSEGLQKAESKLGKFKAGMVTAAKVGAAALAAGLAAASAAFVKFAANADETTKAARALGVTTEELSRLRVGADRSGIAADQLSDALKTLGVNIADVGTGAVNKASQAFEDLGISVRRADGTLKGQREILDEVADAFQKMPDGIDKTSKAAAIFSEGGTGMINMLNGGAEGLRAFDAEADKLGLTISTKTGVAAELFNDNVARLGNIFTGLINRVASNILPWMTDLSTQFFNLTSDSKFFEGAIKGVTNAFKGLLTGGALIVQVWDTVGSAIYAAAQSIVSIIQGDFQGAIDGLSDQWDGFAERTKGRLEFIERLWSEAGAEIGDSATAAALAAAQYSAAMEAARARTAAMERAAKKAAPALAKLRAEMEKQHAEMARLDGVFANTDFRIDMLAKADLAKKEMEELRDQGLEVAGQLGDGLSSAFSDAIKGTGDLKAALLDLAINVIGSVLKNAITQAFKGSAAGPGGGSIFSFIGGLFGGGAASAAGGYASPLGAFRTGGQFSVPGHGGPDSEVAAFRVSPGESVSIDKDGNGGGGPRAITVNVEGANGDKAVEAAVNRGVAAGLAQYDMALPARIVDIDARQF